MENFKLFLGSSGIKTIPWLFMVLLTSCLSGTPKKKKATQAWDLDRMDTSIAPSDDFYQYANGHWLSKTQIPNDESSWGVFYELGKKNDRLVQKLIEDLSQKTQVSGTEKQWVGDFYTSGMDTIAIEKLGLSPIQQELDQIKNCNSISQLQLWVQEQMKKGECSLWSMGVDSDLKNSTYNILYIYQDGLGLPEKSYYSDSSQRFQTYRKAYLQYIKETLIRIGFDPEKAKEQSDAIFRIENQLAKASMDPVESRDPHKIYHKMTQRGVLALLGPWANSNFFQKIGIVDTGPVVVAQPEYIKTLAQIGIEENLEAWKSYLLFHTINKNASVLSKQFEQAFFKFYDQTLRGVQQMRPRKETISQSVGYQLGEAVGKVYVETYFSETSKKAAKDLVQSLILAYAQRIQKLDWMSDTTKKKALKKLEKMVVKVGYPDQWKEYPGLKIEPNQYLKNTQSLTLLETQRNFKEAGKKVDRKKWYMPPHVVNAYYNPSMNEIVFPAAILQAPFFDAKADDAMNYGAIGAVIGHEITHGFDDQGSQFDAEGNLSNWWTSADKARFDQKTKALVAQYDAYTVLDSVHVQGALTLGENIADLGGITLALDALKEKQKKAPVKKIQGFTQEQRVFLAWSRVWAGKYKDDALMLKIKTDPHAPMPFRAVGPLVNLSSFYEAFDIQQGQKMYKLPQERIKIW